MHQRAACLHLTASVPGRPERGQRDSSVPDSRLREALPARAGQSTDLRRHPDGAGSRGSGFRRQHTANGYGGTVPPGRFAELRVPVAGLKARDVSGGTLLEATLLACSGPSGCGRGVPALPGISLENARGYKGLPQKTRFAGSPGSNNDLCVQHRLHDLHAPRAQLGTTTAPRSDRALRPSRLSSASSIRGTSASHQWRFLTSPRRDGPQAARAACICGRCRASHDLNATLEVKEGRTRAQISASIAILHVAPWSKQLPNL